MHAVIAPDSSGTEARMSLGPEGVLNALSFKSMSIVFINTYVCTREDKHNAYSFLVVFLPYCTVELSSHVV